MGRTFARVAIRQRNTVFSVRDQLPVDWLLRESRIALLDKMSRYCYQLDRVLNRAKSQGLFPHYGSARSSRTVDSP